MSNALTDMSSHVVPIKKAGSIKVQVMKMEAKRNKLKLKSKLLHQQLNISTPHKLSLQQTIPPYKTQQIDTNRTVYSRDILYPITANHRRCLNLNTSALFIFSISLLATIQVVTCQFQAAPEEAINKGPHFAPLEDEPVQYIQVGRPVKFKCVVNNLGKHKVAWFHKEKREHLAVDNRTLLWRDRLHAWTPVLGVFELHIEQVQLADMGNYTCQLTTKPPQSQVHALSVLVPPQINEQETTVSIEPVKEFGVAELRCVANGVPKPVIKWRRESQTYKLEPPEELEEDVEPEEEERTGGNELAYDDSYKKPLNPATSLALTREQEPSQQLLLLESDNESTIPPLTQSYQPNPHQQPATNNNNNNNMNNNKQFIAEGEVFRIERVTRHHMGFYLCVANNGVGSSVSQRIFLPVSYSQAHKHTTTTTNHQLHLNRPPQAAQPDSRSPDDIQAGAGGSGTSPRPAKGSRLRGEWSSRATKQVSAASLHQKHSFTTTTTGSSAWSSGGASSSASTGFTSAPKHLLHLTALLSSQLWLLLLLLLLSLSSVQMRVSL